MRVAGRSIRVLAAGIGVVLITVAGGRASSGAGQLDRSFGSGGQVETRGGESADNAVATAGGRSVLVGGAVFHSAPGAANRFDFAVLRYRDNGALDPSFGSGGIAVTSILDQSQVAALALQRNGDIVAAGVAYAKSTPEFALARYLPNGRLDFRFGRGGIVTTPIEAGAFGQSVAVQANGRIIVGGRVADPARNDASVVAIARYLPSGALDPSFGARGVVTNPDGDGAAALALESHGRILVDGGTRLFRFTVTGALDRSFHGSGESVPFPVAAPAAMALTAGGAVVLVGENANTPTEMYALRYTAAGTLDPRFGTHGLVIVPPVSAASPLHTPTDWADAVVARDGKTVLAGWNDDGSSQLCSSFELVRLLSDGRLDPAFGNAGRALVPIANCLSGSPHALTQDRRGDLIATGPATGNGTGYFVTMRFHD